MKTFPTIEPRPRESASPGKMTRKLLFKRLARVGFSIICLLPVASDLVCAEEPICPRTEPPEIVSSWDDLTAGIKNAEDWAKHRDVLHQRFLDLIRDQHKPARPAGGFCS